MRVPRTTFAVIALVTLASCGDDPVHYIDAGNGNGGDIDADTSLWDAAPIDASPPMIDAPPATIDAQPVDGTPQDSGTAQDAQPQDAQPQDAQPPVDSAAPLDSLTGDATIEF